MTEAAFSIAEIPIYGRILLAPMDGISDAPFRCITRRLGSAYTVSEFINTHDFSKLRHYQIARLAFQEAERPFGFQLLDNDAGRMAEVGARLYELFKPDFFDINMGCCAPRVTSRGAGACMMRNLDLIRDSFRRLGQAVPVPLTGKMRLGWDETDLNYRAVAEAVVAEGARLVALHGRTNKMKYGGKARWEPIRELKQALPVPVIGNGDVNNLADARRLFEETGCDGIMIGRAAMANPWIFAGLDRDEVPIAEVFALARYQVRAMHAFYPGEKGLVAFRKFIKAYLAPYGLPYEKIVQLMKVTELEGLLEMLADIEAELGGQGQSRFGWEFLANPFEKEQKA